MDEVFDLAELTLVVDGHALEAPVIGGAVSITSAGGRYEWAARVHLVQRLVPEVAGRIKMETLTEDGYLLRRAAEVQGYEDLDKGIVLLLTGTEPLKAARCSGGAGTRKRLKGLS